VSSMTSIINPPLSDGMEDDEVVEETVVNLWRPGPTVSHVVAEPIEWSTPAAVTIVSIVDHTNQESVCTALLVRELLKRFFPLTVPGHVLGPNENLPTNATLLLVMSSNGCFQRQGFVRQLFQAERLGIGAIPVIVDDSFQFPSNAFFQHLRMVSPYTLSGTGRDIDDLIELIKHLFEEIGICVRPQDSQEVLEVRAEAIALRFSSRRTPLTCERVPVRRSASRSEAMDDRFDLEVVDEDEQVRVKLWKMTDDCCVDSLSASLQKSF